VWQCDVAQNPQVWLTKNADGDEQLEGLRTVKLWLDLIPGASLQRCVKLAFDDFNRRYRDKIIDLVTAFPKDARNIDAATKADMGPFWHGHKRFPQVAEFDVKNPAHLDYVYQGACLYAFIFGIDTKITVEQVRGMYHIPHTHSLTPLRLAPLLRLTCAVSPVALCRARGAAQGRALQEGSG
jgi:hypothetical protein